MTFLLTTLILVALNMPNHKPSHLISMQVEPTKPKAKLSIGAAEAGLNGMLYGTVLPNLCSWRRTMETGWVWERLTGICFFVVVYRRMFEDYRSHMEDGNCRFVARYFLCSPLIKSIQIDFFEKNGLDWNHRTSTSKLKRPRSNVSGWNVWPVNAWLVASMKRFRGLWCEYDEVSSETDSPVAFKVVLRDMSLLVVVHFLPSKLWGGIKGFPIWLACAIFLQKLCEQNKNKHQTNLRNVDSNHHTQPEKYTNETESFRPPYPQLLIQTWLPYWLLAWWLLVSV